jgi:hypothetical protein
VYSLFMARGACLTLVAMFHQNAFHKQTLHVYCDSHKRTFNDGTFLKSKQSIVNVSSYVH